MGQQLKKVAKRRRRQSYLTRKKALAKAGVSRKARAAARSEAKASTKKPAAKKPLRRLPSRRPQLLSKLLRPLRQLSLLLRPSKQLLLPRHLLKPPLQSKIERSVHSFKNREGYSFTVFLRLFTTGYLNQRLPVPLAGVCPPDC